MNIPVDIVVKNLYTPKRLDSYLAEIFVGKLSREEVKRSLDKETVQLNGKTGRPRDRVQEGDHIRGEIQSEEAVLMQGEDIPLKILYEDDSLFVIDKPVGLVVHPGAGNKKGTLVHALLGLNSKLSSVGGPVRPGIVHRLDKDTSGILLVAKNNVAHKALQDQFAARSLSKTYIALVKGRIEFEEGHIDKAMGHDKRVRQKMAVSSEPTARPAQTRYYVLKRFPHATLLEVKLITGRTHQIRVHMQDLGHPVMGDVLYGSVADTKCPRMALHASKIEFIHPKTGKLVKFESPIPAEMKTMIEQAEKEPKRP